MPFIGPWHPLAVGWGVIAMYLLVAVEVTSLAKASIPHRVWRTVHLAAYPVFALATVHALSAGTDTAAVIGDGLAIAIGAVAIALTIVGLDRRAMADPRRPVPAPRPPTGPPVGDGSRSVGVSGAGVARPRVLDRPARGVGAFPTAGLDRLVGLDVLVDGEEVLDLGEQELGQVRQVREALRQRGSWAGTQRILASGPASSVIQNTPTGRTLMWQPGNVGSSSSTRTSSGSPSSASVCGTKP